MTQQPSFGQPHKSCDGTLEEVHHANQNDGGFGVLKDPLHDDVGLASWVSECLADAVGQVNGCSVAQRRSGGLENDQGISSFNANFIIN